MENNLKTKTINEQEQKQKDNDTNDALETNISTPAKSKEKKEKIKISQLIKELEPSKRFFYYFLLVCTFGLIYGYLINRIEENKENVIKTSDEIPFDLNNFIKAFGGINNIVNLSNTINSVKIEVAKIELVDKENIKKITQLGVLSSENKITVILGNYSQKLKELIESQINTKLN